MSVTDFILSQLMREPRAYKKAYDYDANGNCIYFGWAPGGSLKSDRAWTIIKFTYDASLRATDADITGTGSAIWDNRVLLF